MKGLRKSKLLITLFCIFPMVNVKDIDKLGEKITNCTFRCDGVENNPKEAAIPRGFYLELNDRTNAPGIIVVGMNPGRIKRDGSEYREILRNNGSYSNYKDAFERNILYKHHYFKRTRKILKILDIAGPILWTEIVKCQSDENKKLAPQTIRVCVHKFLKKEVSLVKGPILALGNKAYNTCLLIFPERKIIGVYHPSGANVGFDEFLKFLTNKKSRILRKISSLPDNGSINLGDLYRNSLI